VPSLPSSATQVQARVADYLASQKAHTALAVFDRVTGIGLTVNATTQIRTASIVKVNILATLMWQHQQRGTTLTKGQRALAEPMIKNSDNGAASSLWRQIGGVDGLAAANRAFGLHQTTASASGSWGSTMTTAPDQLRLLSVVTDPAGPLSGLHRQYLLDLMSAVVDAQAWGITAAAGTAATAVQVKNGWIPVDAHHGQWTVNSIGRIAEPAHEWIIAILSDHNTTETAGIRLLETTANLALTGLRETAPRLDPAPTEPRP
jgi:beta-lactamase class A